MPNYGPYQDRAKELRRKLGKPGGASNQKIRGRLERLQGRAFFARQPQGPSPVPYSGQYESTVGGLRNQLNQTQADLTGQGLALDQSYGIGDTSNPYAQARQLERQHQQRTLGTNTSLASQGQLYSGAMNNAQSSNRFAFGQASDELLRSYQAEKAGLAREGLGAERDYQTGVLDAEAERLEDALNRPVDPSEAPPVPPAARKYLKDLRQRQNQAQRKGQDNRAERLQNRIRRLRRG